MGLMIEFGRWKRTILHGCYLGGSRRTCLEGMREALASLLFNDLTRKSMEGVGLTASKSVNAVTGISHTHTLTGDMIVRLNGKITKNGRE